MKITKLLEEMQDIPNPQNVFVREAKKDKKEEPAEEEPAEEESDAEEIEPEPEPEQLYNVYVDMFYDDEGYEYGKMNGDGTREGAIETAEFFNSIRGTPYYQEYGIYQVDDNGDPIPETEELSPF